MGKSKNNGLRTLTLTLKKMHKTLISLVYLLTDPQHPLQLKGPRLPAPKTIKFPLSQGNARHLLVFKEQEASPSNISSSIRLSKQAWKLKKRWVI